MVVLITGSNKNIGYHTAKKLAKNNYSSKIIITSRKISDGKIALKNLETDFPKIKFIYHQLDIDDEDSCQSIFNFVEGTFGRLDCLVNNAGIAFGVHSSERMKEMNLAANSNGKGTSFKPNFPKQAKMTIQTNFKSTKYLTELFLPLLLKSPYPKVISLSATSSDLAFNNCHPTIRNKILSKTLTQENLDILAADFLVKAELQTHSNKYSKSAYGMSKIFIRLQTEIWGRSYPRVLFLSCCPGWCKSDLGISGYKRPPKSAEEGADIVYWLVTRPAILEESEKNKENGAFYRDERLRTEWGHAYDKK